MENEQNEIVEQKKVPHLWQKGESGNPKGRPRKSEEEKKLAAEVMSGIRELGPMTIDAMKKILDPEKKVQAMARVKMVEIVLSYILGKPSAEVKLNVSTEEMAEDSEIRIAALIQAVRQGNDLSSGYEAITEGTVESDDIVSEDDSNVES